MKRAILIGNRSGVLRQIGKIPQLELVRVFAVRGSYLDQALSNCNDNVTRFASSQKEEIFRQIEELSFDVLLSQGCPFVLPVSRMRKPGQRFINVHPSYLPRLQGKHPANGALLFGEPFVGATLHEMEDRVDAGRIIHQEKFPLTPDVDLPLLYDLLFDLEGRVFEAGMRKLIDSGFAFAGEEPQGEGSYYSRRTADMQIDFAQQSDADIARRVRAFGVPSQGVLATIDGRPARVIAAEQVHNPHVLTRFATRQAGEMLLSYDGGILVKSRDGIIKVTKLGVP